MATIDRVVLPPGQVLIYGAGLATGINNVVIEGNKYRYGTVQRVYDGAVLVYGGDAVFFNFEDQICRVEYNGVPYLLIEEARLVTVQSP